MTGMRGEEIEYGQWQDIVMHDLLRAMRFLTLCMEQGETVYYVAGHASLSYYYEERDALKWALEIHPSQRPGCYQVTRTKRGYRVKTLYES